MSTKTSIEPRSVPVQTDEGLGRQFAEAIVGKARYSPQSRLWYIWTGSKWAPDIARAVCWEAREFCRVRAAAENNPELLKARTAVMIQRLAESDPRLVIAAELWDTDLWVLNTPDGVVDLRSGEMRPHQATDYSTKQTAVSPSGECDNWNSFLARVTDGDAGLQKLLQRMAGYATTGSTTEQVLFVLHGPGANGKSAFVDTVLRVLGDYALAASMDAFTLSRHDRHPTELARLHGARLVVASEIARGRQWNEARIKQITGGDRIAARFMRKDFFEFTPQFKLVIASNELPYLASVSDAMRRRVIIVPFSVIIPKGERVPDLVEKLRPEWPGILKWAIEGAREWQRIGLALPDCVHRATADYFEGEDLIGQFIAERCEIGGEYFVEVMDLFAAWLSFTKARHEAPGSTKAFSQDIAKRFTRQRAASGRSGFLGLRVAR